MDAIITTLSLLLAVTLSGWLARATRLPLPIVQIAIGVVLALSPVRTVELKPEIFFLLFLPPLLFLDGWRIPKAALVRDHAVMLELALGLVFLTIVGVGLLIHWMIPAIPLPVAFALAAVVSPTDPIAVSAIASRTPIPHRMMHILEGESLLNDATGLVCMRVAVAAMLTGGFSLVDASVTFLWVALGGAAVGAGVAWAVCRAQRLGTRLVGEETSAHILASLIVPFGAYLAAEHFHWSGILAAVAAGVVMGLDEQRGRALGVTRVHRSAVWDTVQFAANGVIFILLGEQLPGILAHAPDTVRLTGHSNPWWLAAYVAAISLALIALRFAWVWTSLRMTVFRAARRGATTPPLKRRLVLVMSLAGVRGALTLAGVLTLPLVLTDGTPFPGRDLAIILAAGVILISLVVASAGLPHALKGVELPEASHHAEEDRARRAAADAALRALATAPQTLFAGAGEADLHASATARVLAYYRLRLEASDRSAGSPTGTEGRFERQLRVTALQAERAEIIRLGSAREVSEETVRKIVRELDYLEVRYSA